MPARVHSSSAITLLQFLISGFVLWIFWREFLQMYPSYTYLTWIIFGGYCCLAVLAIYPRFIRERKIQ
jgi:hypothetical protein